MDRHASPPPTPATHPVPTILLHGKVKMEYFQVPYYGCTKLLELIAFEVLSLEGERDIYKNSDRIVTDTSDRSK